MTLLLLMSAIFFHNPTVRAGVGKSEIVNSAGFIFVCREASAPFKMRFDDGPIFPCEGGFTIQPRKGFQRVVLINQTANQLDVEFYVGDSSVSYNRLRIPGTRLKPTEVSVGPGILEEFPGIDTGNRRKSFMMTNADATHVLYIRSNSEILCMVLPQATSPIIETDADLQIYNNSAGPVQAFVCEIFYTNAV
jgi:hypothetical protein